MLETVAHSFSPVPGQASEEFSLDMGGTPTVKVRLQVVVSFPPLLVEATCCFLLRAFLLAKQKFQPELTFLTFHVNSAPMQIGLLPLGQVGQPTCMSCSFMELLLMSQLYLFHHLELLHAGQQQLPPELGTCCCSSVFLAHLLSSCLQASQT